MLSMVNAYRMRQGSNAAPRSPTVPAILKPRHTGHVLPLCLLLLLFVSSAQACSVPVFAYALRRWEPDVHTLTTSRDEAWRKALGQQAGSAALNLVLEAGEGQDQFSHKTIAGSWWTGSLDAQRQQTLISSPLRRELSKRLASGQSAVWLFIPGGDATADAAARTVLTDRLTYLKKVTELPEAKADDPAASTTLAMGGPPVRLEFSVLDLRRDDAVEWVLAAQVLAMAKDAHGPCAVPVYGRARALDILHGETFTAAAIDDLTRFLTGACSCQVKVLNPGWDLLVACDWYEAMSAATETAAPSATVAKMVPETVVIAPAAVPPSVPSSAPLSVATPPVVSSSLPWVVAIAILVLVSMVMVILRPRRRPAAAPTDNASAPPSAPKL